MDVTKLHSPLFLFPPPSALPQTAAAKRRGFCDEEEEAKKGKMRMKKRQGSIRLPLSPFPTQKRRFFRINLRLLQKKKKKKREGGGEGEKERFKR